MRALHVDFQRPAAFPLGWASLALVLALAIFTGYSYYRTSSALAQVEASAARSRAAAARAVSGADGERLQQELKAASKILDELSLPWDALFQALEQARGERVALLLAQPEPRKRIVTLNGEAKNYDSLFAFVRELEKNPAMTRVHLQSHEVRQNDPQRPIFFTLEAQWGAAR